MNNRLIIYYEGRIEAEPSEVEFHNADGSTIDGVAYLKLSDDDRGDWIPMNTNHIIKTAKTLDFDLQEINVLP